MQKKDKISLDKSQIKTIIDQARSKDTICPTAKKFVDEIDDEYGEDEYEDEPKKKGNKNKGFLEMFFKFFGG